MKKMLVLLAAFVLSAAAASAQTTPPASASPRGMGNHGVKGNHKLTPEQQADRHTQRLTRELGLSADQAAKVRTVALAQAQEAQTLRTQNAATPGRAGRGQAMKTLRDKYEGQLKALLTAEQVAKYDQMQASKMSKQQFRATKNRARS